MADLPGVEGERALLLEDSAKAADETVGERGLRDETDSGRLERAERNVGEELGNGRGTEVDGLSVLTRLVDTKVVDRLLLPELVTVRELATPFPWGKDHTYPPNLKAPWMA